MTATSATKKQAEAIKTRMQQIRTCLPYEVDDARLQVKQLADWKYHYRKRPAIVLGVALAVGYLLVPHSRRPKHTVVYRDQGSSPKAAKKGLLGGILGAFTTMAIRHGTGFAASKLSEVISSGSKTSSSHRS